jgi:hypothetical protein
MNNERRNSTADTRTDTPPADSREGDPRKRDQQDLRTAGRDEDNRAPDDPAKAPESGTP